jgi:hypothetical protein
MLRKLIADAEAKALLRSSPLHWRYLRCTAKIFLHYPLLILYPLI